MSALLRLRDFGWKSVLTTRPCAFIESSFSGMAQKSSRSSARLKLITHSAFNGISSLPWSTRSYNIQRRAGSETGERGQGLLPIDSAGDRNSTSAMRNWQTAKPCDPCQHAGMGGDTVRSLAGEIALEHGPL